MKGVERPHDGDDWCGLTAERLPVAEALEWSVRPDCGAQVLFTGTVRDHADGRTGVTGIDYEAYEEQVEVRLRAIAAEARVRWPEIGRVALLHRVGRLALGEVSVVVVVSTPHRAEAFAAARYCIDTLKSTVPIWKRERWAGGAGWATDARDVTEVGAGGAAGGGGGG